MKKRMISIVMMLVMLISIIPMFAIESEAAQGSSYTANDVIASRMDKALAMFPAGSYFTKNGKACTSCHGNVDCISNGSNCNCLRYVTIDGKPVDLLGVQCFGYAMYWQQMLFGCTQKTNASKFQDLGGTTDNLTRAKLSEWLYNRQDQLHPGTHLRVRYAQHSIVLLDYDLENEKITYIECNWDEKCGVEPVRTLSFSDFIARHKNIYHAFVYKNYYSEYPEKEITHATISPSIYYFNNDGYRMYMKNDRYTKGDDESVKNTLAASNTTPDNDYKFVVTENNGYKIYPEQGKNGYVVNCFWGFGSLGPTSAGQHITLFASDDDPSQRFEFEACDNGYLIHPEGYPNLSWTREGENIVLRSSTNAANQIWVLEDATKCSHTYGGMLSNGSYHWKACTKCGEEAEKEAHRYDNSCDATCNVCGKERTVTHAYSASEHDGYTLYTCSVCGKNYRETHAPKDETCKTHSYGESVVTKNATCTEVGKKEKTCSACGHTVTEDIPVTAHAYSATEYDEYTLYTCSICGKSYKKYYPTQNEACKTHSYDEGMVIREATCTEAGKKEKTCSVCGHTVTEDIPKTGHSFGDWFRLSSSDESTVERRDCKSCGEYEIKRIDNDTDNEDATGATEGNLLDTLLQSDSVVIVFMVAVGGLLLLAVVILFKNKKH